MIRMKRLALFAVLAALVVPAMAGSVAPKEELYVLVPKSVVHPYWARVKKGMEAEAARLGVKAVFDGDLETGSNVTIGSTISETNYEPDGSPDGNAVLDLFYALPWK